jgi:transposase-like protein
MSRRVSDETRARVTQMYHLGTPYQSIARELGLSLSFVFKFLANYSKTIAKRTNATPAKRRISRREREIRMLAEDYRPLGKRAGVDRDAKPLTECDPLLDKLMATHADRRYEIAPELQRMRYA